MRSKMVFSIIRRLKWKETAKATAAVAATAIATSTCSTKLESFRQSLESFSQSLEQLGQSLERLGQSWELFEQRVKFAGTIFIGTACVVATGIMTQELISWYDYESQNDNAFIMYCSDVTRFLRGIWTRQVDWGNLPPEIWGEIGKRMVSQLDIASFRLVCQEWHSSLPSPTGRFPLSLPPPPSCHPKFQDMPYTISELTIYRNRLGWPLKQVDQGGIFHPTNKSFWRNKADSRQASILGLLKRKFHKISFFAKAYYPCRALDYHRRRESTEFPIKLVLISSSNADGVNPNYARICDLSVVAHLGGAMKGRLALLRLGGSPDNWVWDTDFCTQVFVNIATYKGQLCTLDQCGRVFLMDYNSLKLNRICAPLFVPPELEQKSLLEACGDLYLVDFKPTNKGDAKAYMLSLRHQTWLKVEDFWSGSFKYVAPVLL